MSDKKKDCIPLECPGNENIKKVEPVVDVVKNELYPPMNAQVQQIISKNEKN